ncbi:hypothetical protein D3C72_1207270 [compost metagenome]
MPSRGVQPPVRRDVGARHHELLLQGHRPAQAQEEALAGPEPADDEPDGCTAGFQSLEIGQDGRDLVFTADLDVSDTDTRHHACTQRLKNGISFPGLDGHLTPPPSKGELGP